MGRHDPVLVDGDPGCALGHHEGDVEVAGSTIGVQGVHLLSIEEEEHGAAHQVEGCGPVLVQFIEKAAHGDGAGEAPPPHPLQEFELAPRGGGQWADVEMPCRQPPLGQVVGGQGPLRAEFDEAVVGALGIVVVDVERRHDARPHHQPVASDAARPERSCDLASQMWRYRRHESDIDPGRSSRQSRVEPGPAGGHDPGAGRSEQIDRRTADHDEFRDITHPNTIRRGLPR